MPDKFGYGTQKLFATPLVVWRYQGTADFKYDPPPGWVNHNSSNGCSGGYSSKNCNPIPHGLQFHKFKLHTNTAQAFVLIKL
ncbi:hypothetical protein GCM10027181_34820 [Rheinheimera gaetbuli]